MDFNRYRALFESDHSKLLVPERPHISPSDGGHLLIVPNRKVRSRIELTPIEALDISFVSVLGSKLLTNLLGTEWFNYQENGNWSLDEPDAQHMHLHIYGRHENSVFQTHGEALCFPLKKDVGEWSVTGLSAEQIENAIIIVRLLTREAWVQNYMKSIRIISQIQCK